MFHSFKVIETERYCPYDFSVLEQSSVKPGVFSKK